MKISDEYNIEADKHNWILVQNRVDPKTGNRPKQGHRTYWATLKQVVDKMVALEVREIEDLKAVANSVDIISANILKQVVSDLRTGPYRIYKHGEKLWTMTENLQKKS